MCKALRLFASERCERSTVLETTIAAILVFGLIIFVHELGHFMVAKKTGITVLEFAIGMGPILFKKERNKTMYSLRLLPVGGFVQMEGEDEAVDAEGSFSSKPFLTKIAVLLAGSIMNILLGYIVLVILTVMNGYVGTTYIVDFTEGSVSQSVLQYGDKITKVNGHTVRTSNDITYEFLRDVDGLIDMTIVRNEETMVLPVQFQLEDIGDGINAINIDFRVAAVPAQAMDYVTYPVNWGISIIKQVWGSLIDLLTGRYAVNQLSGPVGIVSAIGQATKIGLESVLMMGAFIAINIGVFNLLPLPILDGGKIVLFTIEKLIGRPISEKVMEVIMGASVVFVLFLAVYATYNDIFRLVTK